MANNRNRAVHLESSSGARFERRWLLTLGAAAAAAAAAAGLAACGAEDEGAGTRDNPFPYSEERTKRLRTRM